MDKLDDLRGIGRASAERLAKAGIDTFAKLATSTDEQLQAIANLPGDPKLWAGWRAEAGTKASAPRAMTAEELSALVLQWDDARAALKAAGDAVALLQTNPDATTEAIAEAQAKNEAAQAAIAALAPLPEGITLPPAAPVTNTQGTGPATPALTSPAPVVAQGTNTTPPTTANEGGGNQTAPEAPELVKGETLTNVRWMKVTHPPHTTLELPRDIAMALLAQRAFRLT